MKIFRDSFANLLTGIGLGNPKTAANNYALPQYSEQELDAAYRASTWFAKIVDIPADDAVRNWRNWQTDKKNINKLTTIERKMGVRAKVREALIASRTFGGAVIYLGGLPGDPATPIDATKLKINDLKYMTVFNRYEITAGPIENDPASPYFRMPSEYTLNTATGTGMLKIHASRMVRFVGRRTNVRTGANQGWGDPVWTQMRDAVTNADSASGVVAALLQEAKTDIVRLDDMMGQMATDDYSNLLLRRFETVAMLKSVTGVSVLDKADEWDQKQITWSGLPDVVRLLLVIMAGAADIPVVRLIGTSASGLNATGEGDLKNYYDRVRSEQENTIGPALTVLDNIIVRSALGNYPDGLWYDWSPLWQPTAKERAEVNKTNSEADQKYADAGLVPVGALAKAVQNRLIESGEYPGLDEALDDPSLLDQPDEPDADEGNEPPRVAANDAAPLPLYVSRKVTNAAEILAWAKKQGFKSPESKDDLHVTIIYTTNAVDWMRAGEAYDDTVSIARGGPRVIERFDGGATVLSFAASTLSWRHESIKRRTDAMVTYEHYQPHITISYESGIDVTKIEPYTGKIELGPEIFKRADQ